MGDLVFIDAVQKRRNDGLDALWAAYLDARAKAESSADIQDGIAAGKAWAAWLDAFRTVGK